MSALFDLFGFLAVLLHGLDLVAQSVLVGSVAFALFVAAPLELPARTQTRGRRIVRFAAIATLITTGMATLVSALALRVSLDLGMREIAGATFVVAGVAKAAAAATIACLVRALTRSRTVRVVSVVACSVVLGAALTDTHAIARIDGSVALTLATIAHMLGAALWLGGLPCFWWALRDVDPAAAMALGRRFSLVAAFGVALIVAGAVVFAIFYIGSIDGVYGTAYGAMATTKGVLLAILLALGCANFLATHGIGTRMPILRTLRFVEVEMGIGVAVLMAAASITAATPSVDVVADRVTLAQIAHRVRPEAPRLTSPPPGMLSAPAAAHDGGRNAQDRAWSEYNHHWAGLLVVLMGIAALAQRTGHAPFARHWPLLFLLLALFLLVRADPEVWPLGPLGPIESLRDPEVAQHRLFVVMIVAFALFEWRVRTGRIESPALVRVFPLVTAAGATLLLTHSHAVGDVKEQLLIEMTHLPIAVLGIVAGWSRWLEVAAPRAEGRWAAWVWPSAFVLIGLLLLDYREA